MNSERDSNEKSDDEGKLVSDLLNRYNEIANTEDLNTEDLDSSFTRITRLGDECIAFLFDYCQKPAPDWSESHENTMHILRVVLVSSVLMDIASKYSKDKRLQKTKIKETKRYYRILARVSAKLASESGEIHYKIINQDDDTFDIIKALGIEKIGYALEHFDRICFYLLDNRMKSLAYRLLACKYNIMVATYLEQEELSAELTKWADSLNERNEYECAVLIYCILLYAEVSDETKEDNYRIFDGFSHKSLSDSFEFSPMQRACLELKLAESLTKLAERCEVVSAATEPPFALYDVEFNQYRFLSETLRRIAILVLDCVIENDISDLDSMILSKGIGRLHPDRLIAILYMQSYKSASVDRIDGVFDDLERGYEQSRHLRSLPNCLPEVERKALRIEYLLYMLKSVARGDQTSRTVEGSVAKKWKAYIGELQECVFDMQQLAETEDASQMSSQVAGFINDNRGLLSLCAALLSNFPPESEDGYELILQIVRIAINAHEFKRSRLCSFPTEQDYIIDELPYKLVYPLITRLLARGCWDKRGGYLNSVAKGFAAAYYACTHRETDFSALENNRDAISFYAPLSTAYHLFDKLYYVDGCNHPVTEEEMNRNDGYRNKGKIPKNKKKQAKSKTSYVGKKEYKNCLTVMHASYMNDPNEGITLLRRLGCSQKRPFRDKWDGLQDKVVQGSMVFMKSFTTHVDQLHMWSMYGRDTSGVDAGATGDCDGCCICLSRDMFATNLRVSEWDMRCSSDSLRGSTGHFNVEVRELYKVLYLDENERASVELDTKDGDYLEEIHLGLQKVSNLIDLHAKNQSPSKTIEGLGVSEDELLNSLVDFLGPIAFLVKDGNYSREGEIRLLFKLPLDKASRKMICKIHRKPPYRSLLCLRPFEQVYIEKIILGPKFPSPHEVSPQLMLQLLNMKDIALRNGVKMDGSVRFSKIDYR